MTTLYNCKHSGDEYRITKFVDGEPEGSYLCTFEECECPAGSRPTCRHRQMLPKFIQRGAVDVGWWYDFDRGGWTDMRTNDELNEIIEANQEVIEAIRAEAVGEPEAKLPSRLPWRRF